MYSEKIESGQVAKAGVVTANGAIRFRVIGLGVLAVVICYMDRMNISVAIIPMAEQFGWDKTTSGFILSSFYFGYVGTQILGGWLADRFGGKVVLGVGVLVWSLFTVLTAPAAYFGILVLVIARVLMGLGEGVTYPAVYSLFARWSPPNERSRSISLALSAMHIGTIAALMLTPPLIVALGWESAFYLFGILGIVWWIAWNILVSSTPEEHPRVSSAELALIHAGSPPTDDHRVPVRAMLRHPAVWAIIVAFFCTNWTAYVLLAWLPTYVVEALGVDLASVGFFAVGPLIFGAIGYISAGWVADLMLQRGVSRIAVRKIMNSIGFGSKAVILISLGFVSSAPLAIALLCGAMFFGATAMAGCGTSPLDIAPRASGTLFGIANTLGSIPGFVAVTVSGMILDATGSWAMVFNVAAGFAVIGMITYVMFASAERIFD